MSISQETIPQQNPISKPAHPHLLVHLLLPSRPLLLLGPLVHQLAHLLLPSRPLLLLGPLVHQLAHLLLLPSRPLLLLDPLLLLPRICCVVHIILYSYLD